MNNYINNQSDSDQDLYQEKNNDSVTVKNDFSKEDNIGNLGNVKNLVVTSSSFKHKFLKDIKDFDDDLIMTKKKEFESKIIPYEEIRKSQIPNYIWIACYDELLSTSNLIQIIKKCKNTSLPIEWISIHLNNYKIIFNKVDKTNEIRPFLVENKSSVSFVKLYLINKNQVIDIFSHMYTYNDLNNSEIENFEKCLDKGNWGNFKKFGIENNEYGQILLLGELDGIKIVSATCSENYVKNKNSIKPEISYLRTLFNELRNAFNPYSNYFIMYYVYMMDGVKQNYNVDELCQVFYLNKETDKQTIQTKNIDKTLLCQTYYGNSGYANNLNNLNYNNTLDGNNRPEVFNKINQALNLLEIPSFDEKTGEFKWPNNSNVNFNSLNLNFNKSFIKSDDIYKKSVDLRNGSLLSLNSSILYDGDEENIDDNLNNNVKNITRIIYDDVSKNNNLNTTNTNFPTQSNLNSEKHSTLIEDLNNLLKKIDV